MDKDSLLQQLQAAFDELLAAVKGLDERAMAGVFYGTWSVKDILAHIAGWHHQMTGAMERMARGEKPTPEGVDYSNSDEWNAKFAERMRGQLPTTVLAEWGQVHGGFMIALRNVPDDRFGEGKSVNRIAEGTASGHYREHAPAIQEWRQREGI